MATPTLGFFATPLTPGRSEGAPFIGKVVFIDSDTDAVTLRGAPTNTPQGEACRPVLTIVPGIEFAAAWYDWKTSAGNPPGTIGKLDGAGVVPDLYTLTELAGELQVAPGQLDPLSGSTSGPGAAYKMALVQLLPDAVRSLNFAKGNPSLKLYGYPDALPLANRLFIRTDAGGWASVRPGQGIAITSAQGASA